MSYTFYDLKCTKTNAMSEMGESKVKVLDRGSKEVVTESISSSSLNKVFATFTWYHGVLLILGICISNLSLISSMTV